MKARRFSSELGCESVCRMCKTGIVDGDIVVMVVVYGKRHVKHLRCHEPVEVG